MQYERLLHFPKWTVKNSYIKRFVIVSNTLQVV